MNKDQKTKTIRPDGVITRNQAQLQQASAHLRQAEQALAGLKGLVGDVPYAQWNQQSRALPLSFLRWLLGAAARKLEDLAQVEMPPDMPGGEV